MEILIILLLIFLNGLFAMSEMALVSARKLSLSSDAKKGSKTAKTALKLIEEPSKLLSTVQIGITSIGVLTGLYSGATLSDDFSEFLLILGVSESTALILAQAIIVVIVTLLSIVLGELVPKRIGMSSAETISKIVSGPMLFISWLASPFVYLLSKATDLLVRLLGVKNQDAKVTEEEIKSMIAEGIEDGEVLEVEQDIVERVFSLGDRKVDSIMTSRNEIIWLDTELTKEEIYKTVEEDLHDVYPVANGSLDEIIGVVFLKDLFVSLNESEFDLAKLTRPVEYFYEYMDVYKVLQNMKDKLLSYGLVCDEFGVCQGIVTHKDILAALVGSLHDEPGDFDFEEQSPGVWIVDGQCPFYDFLEYFELEELFSDTDYNTIGGLILELLERIPKEGEKTEWNGLSLEVSGMDGARIDKIIVTKLDAQENADLP